jgi:hypothetical protein
LVVWGVWGLGGVLAVFGHSWWCRVGWGRGVLWRVSSLFRAGVVGVLVVPSGLGHGPRRGLWRERRFTCERVSTWVV